jgi:hypothetical protein
MIRNDAKAVEVNAGVETSTLDTRSPEPPVPPITAATKKRGRRPVLSPQDCRDISASYADPKSRETVATLARLYRVTPGTIHKVLDGKYRASEAYPLKTNQDVCTGIFKNTASAGERDVSEFKPFENESQTIAVGGLTVENRHDRVSLYGSLDLTLDEDGLARARELLGLVKGAIEHLERREDLPTKITTAPIGLTENPF